MSEPTPADGAHGTVIANVWELQPGDQVDGRTVTAVTDDGTDVTATFTSGKPLKRPRGGEITLTRWYDLPPVPEGWAVVDV